MALKTSYRLVFILAFFLSSCEFKCSIGDSDKNDADEKNKPVQKEGALLYNGIELNAQQLKVEKAYLVFDDDSRERVPQDNFVQIERGIKLLLLIKSGWTEKEGRVYPGASMKVVTDSGETLLTAEDIFKEYESTGVSPEDAKSLSLSVYFKSWKARGPVSLNVTFRVWDKNSEAYIDGSYTVHTK